MSLRGPEERGVLHGSTGACKTKVVHSRLVTHAVRRVRAEYSVRLFLPGRSATAVLTRPLFYLPILTARRRPLHPTNLSPLSRHKNKKVASLETLAENGTTVRTNNSALSGNGGSATIPAPSPSNAPDGSKYKAAREERRQQTTTTSSSAAEARAADGKESSCMPPKSQQQSDPPAQAVVPPLPPGAGGAAGAVAAGGVMTTPARASECPVVTVVTSARRAGGAGEAAEGYELGLSLSKLGGLAEQASCFSQPTVQQHSRNRRFGRKKKPAPNRCGSSGYSSQRYAISDRVYSSRGRLGPSCNSSVVGSTTIKTAPACSSLHLGARAPAFLCNVFVYFRSTRGWKALSTESRARSWSSDC